MSKAEMVEIVSFDGSKRKSIVNACPFCGSHEIVIEADTTSSVAVCRYCKARGPEVRSAYDSRTAFIEWNRRTE